MQSNVFMVDSLAKKFSETFLLYMTDIKRFSKYYDLLFSNLEPSQKFFLLSIFTRTLFMAHGHVYLENTFTENEIEEQGFLKKEFYPKIKPLEDGSFMYNNYILPINHFEAGVFYYELGISVIQNPSKLEGRDFIDVGAYIGDSAIVLNNLNPSKIHAFEPVKYSYDLIFQTMKLNMLEDRIIPVHMGLGASAGEIELGILDAASSALSWQNDYNKPRETVKVDTIDNYVERNNLDVALIKLDTEGMELDEIIGAEKTIKKFKPLLLVSIYHNAQEFFEIKPLLESWNLGYKFFFAKLNPEHLLFETVMICEAG